MNSQIETRLNPRETKTIPLKGIETLSDEQLETKAQELLKLAEVKRNQRLAQAKATAETERKSDMDLLFESQKRLQKIEKLLPHITARKEIEELLDEQIQLQTEIGELEQKWAIDDAPEVEPELQIEKEPISKVRIVTMILSIIALLVGSYLAVMESGDAIKKKYTNPLNGISEANVYNEVSFQKALFGAALVVFAVSIAIVLVNVYFPKIGKYLNPFWETKIDLSKDWDTLKPEIRCGIAVFIFALFVWALVTTFVGNLS